MRDAWDVKEELWDKIEQWVATDFSYFGRDKERCKKEFEQLMSEYVLEVMAETMDKL